MNLKSKIYLVLIISLVSMIALTLFLGFIEFSSRFTTSINFQNKSHSIEMINKKNIQCGKPSVGCWNGKKIIISSKDRSWYEIVNICTHELKHLKLGFTEEKDHEIISKMYVFETEFYPWNYEKKCLKVANLHLIS